MTNRYEKIFGAYDIRGVVEEDMDTPKVTAIAHPYGEYLCSQKSGRFVIGHDER